MNLKIIFVLFSLVFFSSFLIITSHKPLQMDELATHHQIYDKSFEELKASINTGMNWMPAGYFILLWTIDKFLETNSFTLRFVNLIFITCALLYCKSFLSDYESDNINILAIITIFSHSLDIPFILTEARPYALYFLLSCILIKIYSDLTVLKENKKFYPSLILINFLIPFTFYIGGVYCFLALITFCFIKIKKRNSLFYLILNVLSGWALFFIFSFNTFLKQLSNTFGSIHNSHTNLQDLFTLYGIQVYFPIILLLFIGFCTIFKKESLSDEYNETSDREYFLLLNSIIWALTPLLFFIFGKLTDKSFLQTRYYTPNLASYILFYV